MKVVRILTIILFLAALPVGAEQFEDVNTAPFNMGTPQASGPVWSPQRAILWDNGPLVTHPGAGAGGADESAVQNTSLGMSSLGLAHQFASGNSIADEFTIPAGETWQIDTITTYAYQTGAGSPSTIAGVYMQIYNGSPDSGGSVVWGDLTTNRIGSTNWSNIYRVAETSSGDTSRAIMASEATVNTVLTEGTYWVEWSADGSASYSGPWAPPVTVIGQTTTGNALQYFSGAWQAALDGGTASPQGFPFIVEGTVQGQGGGGGGSTGGGEPIPTLSNTGIFVLILALIGISVVLIRRRM